MAKILAPKTCRLITEEEFQHRVLDADGETIGVYGDIAYAQRVEKSRNERYRDEFMRNWRTQPDPGENI